MAAYAIIDIEVLDKEKYEPFRQLVTKTVEQYGGKYIVRGGGWEVLEGTWAPRRLVILEFPTMAQAKAWYNSPEYGEGKLMRHKISRAQIVIVEGVGAAGTAASS